MRYLISTACIFLMITFWLSSYANSQQVTKEVEPEVKTVTVERVIEKHIPTPMTDTHATSASITELQKQILAINENMSRLVEMNQALIAENSKLKNSVTEKTKEKESPLLDPSLDDKYTWVSDPQTGWPRAARTVWQRTNVGSSAVLECLVRDGKVVPTGAITINGHQGGYTGSNGGGGQGGGRGRPMSRQQGVQIIRGGR